MTAMSESLLSGKLLHSSFASLLSFALSSKVQSKICCRDDCERCKVNCFGRIPPDLATFAEFAMRSCDVNCTRQRMFLIARVKPTVHATS